MKALLDSYRGRHASSHVRAKRVWQGEPLGCRAPQLREAEGRDLAGSCLRAGARAGGHRVLETCLEVLESSS